METLRFTADYAGGDEDEYCLVAVTGIDGTETYVSFQRHGEYGHEEDWGIYFEFNDQINGGYNNIASCRIDRSALHVILTEPIDHAKRFVDVVVALQINDDEFDAFVSMLRRIFVRSESLLFIQ